MDSLVPEGAAVCLGLHSGEHMAQPTFEDDVSPASPLSCGPPGDTTPMMLSLTPNKSHVSLRKLRRASLHADWSLPSRRASSQGFSDMLSNCTRRLYISTLL